MSAQQPSATGSGNGNDAARAIGADGSSSLPPCYSAFLSFLRARDIRCVVFDMDRTLVSQHSGGCVPSAQLDAFAASLTPTARVLIPLLLAEGLRVCVATFADDLYAAHSHGGRDYVAGVTLVRRVLAELEGVTQEQLQQVPIVTLNPDLYVVRRSHGMAAAAAEEQRQMKALSLSASSSSAASSGSSAACAEAAVAPAAPAPVSPTSPLHAFFHSKLLEFGFGPDHRHWANLSVFPPRLPLKNLHLQLIGARLDLAPRHMLLLDDRDENVDAARQMGCFGLYLTRKRGLVDADLCEGNIQPPVDHGAAAQQGGKEQQ